MSHSVPNRNWSYPTAIKFGVGRISELADHAKSIGLKKPLLVTDKALASLPITAAALDVLDGAGLGRAAQSGDFLFHVRSFLAAYFFLVSLMTIFSSAYRTPLPL